MILYDGTVPDAGDPPADLPPEVLGPNVCRASEQAARGAGPYAFGCSLAPDHADERHVAYNGEGGIILVWTEP